MNHAVAMYGNCAIDDDGARHGMMSLTEYSVTSSISSVSTVGQVLSVIFSSLRCVRCRVYGYRSAFSRSFSANLVSRQL